jgi:carboxymethylenebutenolidase
MSNRVSFPAAGGEATGVLVVGDGTDRRAGVVLIHEWWGVNEQIQGMAARWASEGFIALVPDLFHGKCAGNADEAAAMMNALDFARAVQEIAGAVAFLRAHARCTGKVSVTGYCMGGALSFATAREVPKLSAVVPFYGLPGGDGWDRVDAPIQAHFAQHDDWATVEGAKQIQAALAAHGRQLELHVYDAKHAFCNERRPEVHDAEAAATAWQRAVGFIRDHSA